MKKYIIFPIIILLTALMGFTPPTEKVNWVSIEKAVELAEEDGKKIIVDMYTDWCGWCKRMDATTYKNPEVIKYINENYHAVKFDGEEKRDVTIKGRTFKFVNSGRRGYHEIAGELMNGRLSYPTTVFLDSNIKILTTVPGYQTAPNFLPILAYFGEDAYLEQGWQEFQKEFQNNNGK